MHALTHQYLRRLAVGALAVVVAAVALVVVRPDGADASVTSTSQAVGATGHGNRRFSVEVAEDVHDFVFDDDVVYDDGMPAHGSAFVTHGYLYRAGFLEGRSGVDTDGGPAYPDAVIGEWWCKGYLIGDAAHATEGAWVYSTQLFAFGDDPETGRRTIVVTGYEGAEVGAPGFGAVTGGTGRYATARGEARQTLLGFDDSEGVAKEVTFILER